MEEARFNQKVRVNRAAGVTVTAEHIKSQLEKTTESLQLTTSFTSETVQQKNSLMLKLEHDAAAQAAAAAAASAVAASSAAVAAAIATAAAHMPKAPEQRQQRQPSAAMPVDLMSLPEVELDIRYA